MTGSGGAAFTTLMSMMSVPTRSLRRVAVFSGHLCGNNPAYAQAAAALGEELAKRKIAVICGGHLHTTGLAKAVADSALEHGGNIITVVRFIKNKICFRSVPFLEFYLFLLV